MTSGQRLLELYRYRELVRNLTVRDLKLKYKRSVLGIAWSFLNPLLMMAVYTAVFSVLQFGGFTKGSRPGLATALVALAIFVLLFVGTAVGYGLVRNRLLRSERPLQERRARGRDRRDRLHECHIDRDRCRRKDAGDRSRSICEEATCRRFSIPSPSTMSTKQPRTWRTNTLSSFLAHKGQVFTIRSSVCVSKQASVLILFRRPFRCRPLWASLPPV